MTGIGRSKLFSLAYFRSFIKFSIVGASGVVVNEGLLIAFLSLGVYLLYADAAAIEISILTNFVMNDLWTFKDRRSGHFATRLAKFNALMLVGLVVNLAVVDLGTLYFGIAAAIANLGGIGAAFLLRYALSVKYAWMRTESIEGAAEQVSAPTPVLRRGEA
jgi:dolichol-phosphate mannosyltransferase